MAAAALRGCNTMVACNMVYIENSSIFSQTVMECSSKQGLPPAGPAPTRWEGPPKKGSKTLNAHVLLETV